MTAESTGTGQAAVRELPSTRVAVLGATGYVGRELIAILARHPQVRITRLMSSGKRETEPRPIEKIHPALRGSALGAGIETLCEPLNLDDLTGSEVDLVFLATSHETSHESVPLLLERGLRVIDLSGAFRLREAAAYARWYGFEHRAAPVLGKAVYGLPELNAEAIRTAQLVANPGCYATSIILALAPLLHAACVDLHTGIVCDSKSGASGAGRAPSEKLHFVEVNENCRAYGIFNHRHIPEVAQTLRLEEGCLTFTPHLLPVNRGILSTIYVRLLPERALAAGAVRDLYEGFYARAPMVRLCHKAELPEIQSVAHSNYADIGFALDPATRRLVIVTALDNLGKGAGGQAVENMNLMFGYLRETALG